VQAASVRVPRPLLGTLAVVLAAMLALALLEQLTTPVGGVRQASAAASGATPPAARAVATFTAAHSPHRRTADGEILSPRWQVVVAAARSQVGGRYATYGDTPATGFSCVGLVRWAFAQAGIAVPEDEYALARDFAQVRGATPAGDVLLPGDILLFHDTGPRGLSHAAIYVGGGMMVSADSPAQGVQLEPLDQPFWVTHWAFAVRVPGLSTYAAPSA
jgi:cell wall-associated NlpC family hydrolase